MTEPRGWKEIQLKIVGFLALNYSTLSLCSSEKMISSEVLEGVPLLVLANKQDVEVRPIRTITA